MIKEYPEYYLSQPAIYFGMQGIVDEESEDVDSCVSFSFFDPPIQLPTGMYIDW